MFQDFRKLVMGCRSSEVRGPSTSVSPGHHSQLQQNPAGVYCPEYITNPIDLLVSKSIKEVKATAIPLFYLPPSTAACTNPQHRRHFKKTTECQVPWGCQD